MFEIMTMASSTLAITLIPGLALPFLYIYLVHDYAGRRVGDRDPLLGSKVFTTMLMTVGAHLDLAGISTVAVALMGDHFDGGELLLKTGTALMLAGVVIGAFPAYLYFTRVRTRGGARVGHQALGLNALLCGLAFAAAVVVASQALLHDGGVAEPAAVALVYGLAMVITGMRLLASPIATATLESDGE